MGMVSVERTDWTVSQVQAIPYDGNRYEIIDGVLYVTPSPMLPHQIVLSRLHFRLMGYADALGFDVLESPADFVFSDNTLVQPDLFVFPRVDGLTVAHYDDIEQLTLAVEVLSRSTARRDRTVKRRLYQTQRIPEYWILDIAARSVERWRPDSLTGEVFKGSLEWQPDAQSAPLVVDLEKVFGHFRGKQERAKLPRR